MASSSYSGLPTTPTQTIQWAPYNSFGPQLGMGNAYTIGGGFTPEVEGAMGGIQGLAGMLANAANPAIKDAYQTQSGIEGIARRLMGLSKQDLKTVLPFTQQLDTLGQKMGTEFDFNMPYAKQALSDAYDPLNSAYQYYLNQVNSAVGAQEAAAGLGATPYGAYETAAADAAFNNQWQMERLQRELTGAQTATALENEILSGQTAGGEMIAKGGELANQAYATSGKLLNDAGQLDIGGLQGVLQAYGLKGQDLSAAMQGLVGLLNSMRISTSSSGGGGGGGSSGGGLGMQFGSGGGGAAASFGSGE